MDAQLPAAELSSSTPTGWPSALAIHAAMSLGFGLIYGLLLPRFRPIPATLAWGGC